MTSNQISNVSHRKKEHFSKKREENIDNSAEMKEGRAQIWEMCSVCDQGENMTRERERERGWKGKREIDSNWSIKNRVIERSTKEEQEEAAVREREREERERESLGSLQSDTR